MTERLRVLFAIELDRDRLLEHRDELLSRGEVLYHEETFSAGTITVKDWPGEPHEWESLTDLVDLMAPGVDAITRTELLEVGEGPAPAVQLSGRKRSGWRRLIPWLPLFVAIVVALSFASSSPAAVKIGTAADDYLVGTKGDDVLKGLGGNDELHAKAGNDLLVGGRGRDLLDGAGGRDQMQGGGGRDVLYAWGSTSGIDTLTCGPRVDWAYVGPLDIAADGSCEHWIVLP
jgi:hemolysin type calcium-binding protein